jgi:uncharacterized UBP type Zn finger protein
MGLMWNNNCFVACGRRQPGLHEYTFVHKKRCETAHELAVCQIILPTLDSKDFPAFFVERCDDHVAFLGTNKGNFLQPRLHPGGVAVQYLQHNCA